MSSPLYPHYIPMISPWYPCFSTWCDAMKTAERPSTIHLEEGIDSVARVQSHHLLHLQAVAWCGWDGCSSDGVLKPWIPLVNVHSSTLNISHMSGNIWSPNLPRLPGSASRTCEDEWITAKVPAQPWGTVWMIWSWNLHIRKLSMGERRGK
jgi:hypothetical protein